MINLRANSANRAALWAALFTSLLATASAGCESRDNPGSGATQQLYMDVHELGAGKVTAEAVAKAHTADLGAQGRHGVEFLRY